MVDLLLCGWSLSCHFRNLQDIISGPKYPSEVAEICQYFDKQRIELPDYCKFEVKPVRRRNEF